MKKATGILIIVILLMVAGFGVWLYLQELDRQQLPSPPDPGQQTTKKPDPKPDPPKPPEEKSENYAIFTMGMPNKDWSGLTDEEYAEKYPKPQSVEFQYIHGYYKKRNEKFPYVIYLLGTKEKQPPEVRAALLGATAFPDDAICEHWFRLEIEYIKDESGKVELYLVDYRLYDPAIPGNGKTNVTCRYKSRPERDLGQIDMKFNGKMAPGEVIEGRMDFTSAKKNVLEISVRSSKIRFRCKLEPFPDE